MSTPLGILTPPLVGSPKQIIIHLYPTPVLEHYNVQVTKVGLDDKNWAFVLEMMLHAIKPVLQTLVTDEVMSRLRQMGQAGFVLPSTGERV
jgi:hypothetical protein